MTLTRQEWEGVLKSNGVDVGEVERTLQAACCQPGIPSEEIALAEIALQHSADMFTAAKLSLAIAYGREAFARADGLRKEIGLIPEVVRNRARDTGTRKPRNVAVKEAVHKLVARHPALTAKELWQEAPSAITENIKFRTDESRVGKE